MTQTLPADSPLSSGPSLQGTVFLLDHDAFLPCFNELACFVRHRLVDHPLLAMPRLLELANRHDSYH